KSFFSHLAELFFFRQPYQIITSVSLCQELFLNFSSTEVAFQSFSVAHSNFYRLSYLQSLVNIFFKTFFVTAELSAEKEGFEPSRRY
ncbi:hypothetical protein, partial [Blautia sp. HCN-20427]|uniref:hypothetical protein n=1 Tax=Blautia sp. HCN-20427 TaxID=3134659 RepID=UPI0030C4F60A